MKVTNLVTQRELDYDTDSPEVAVWLAYHQVTKVNAAWWQVPGYVAPKIERGFAFVFCADWACKVNQ